MNPSSNVVVFDDQLNKGQLSWRSQIPRPLYFCWPLLQVWWAITVFFTVVAEQRHFWLHLSKICLNLFISDSATATTLSMLIIDYTTIDATTDLLFWVGRRPGLSWRLYFGENMEDQQGEGFPLSSVLVSHFVVWRKDLLFGEAVRIRLTKGSKYFLWMTVCDEITWWIMIIVVSLWLRNSGELVTVHTGTSFVAEGKGLYSPLRLVSRLASFCWWRLLAWQKMWINI